MSSPTDQLRRLAEHAPTRRPVRIEIVPAVSSDWIYSRTTHRECIITVSEALIDRSLPAARFAVAHELAHHRPDPSRRSRAWRRWWVWLVGIVVGAGVWVLFPGAVWPPRLAAAALGTFIVTAFLGARLNRADELAMDRLALRHTGDRDGARDMLTLLAERRRSWLVAVLGRHPAPQARADHLALGTLR